MPALLQHLHPGTSMGANLIGDDGATFRVWAPTARHVHLVSDLSAWQPTDENALHPMAHGHWGGFWPGFRDGSEYKFWIEGTGSSGCKRDPYARELSLEPKFPRSNCIVRDPRRYPWRVQNFRPPAFHELLIYQLHVSTFESPQGGSQPGTFLDVIKRIPYIRDLGFNAVQLLPIQESEATFSMGYDGSDYFSPEMSYSVTDVTPYLGAVNDLLSARGLLTLRPGDLEGGANQLRCLVDIAHAYGVAVIFDVVYNHAGGWTVDGVHDDESLYFFDRQEPGDNNRSLYFTSEGESGGLCFALWQAPVRQFLIDNAKFLLEEFRIDGFRHDHVRVLFNKNGENGKRFSQDLNATCKYLRPDALQHAECWPPQLDLLRPVWDDGMAFDTCYVSGLRDTLWTVLDEVSQPFPIKANLTAVSDRLWAPGLSQSWRGIQQIETHDEVYRSKPERSRTPRRADGADHRSWYARSRSRVAQGIIMTAPGIPMIFMGQEFLEHKLWADHVRIYPELRIDWAGLNGSDPSMRDHLRFTRELAWLRRQLPGLTGEGFRPTHVHDDDRVLAFHRWVPGVGGDVIVVASFSNTHHHGYRIGFPWPGQWLERFNSDVYDRWVNPNVAGNGGSIRAENVPWQGFAYSAEITLPANAILVFAQT